MTSPPGSEFGPAISARNLRKTYKGGAVVAVGGLDLTVPAGGVHGFLGPNGSGKTTTLRMLLGLIRPDEGAMEILGRSVPAELPQVIDEVGAIIESPRFFPNFSGRKNLVILAQAIGAPATRVGQVLEQVGLAGRAKDAFRTYSLGMRQRLAIAATLLKDPRIFIFDEPTNGLDPAGIHEIRETMRSLADGGKTVLVSSHILSEVEQVADTVSIIGRGRLLAEGPVKQILAAGTKQAVEVGAADLTAAARILEGAGFAVATADALLLVTATAPAAAIEPSQIARLLGAEDIWVTHLAVRQQNLEQIFLELTESEHLGRTQGGHGIRAAGFGMASGGAA